MLYYLFRFLEQNFDFPGAGLFDFVTFRAAITLITSLFLSMIVGKHIINFLKRKQIGETIRELGLAGENQKKNTPTMGGIIILIAILLPCLLFGRLRNIYLIIMLVTTAWLGLIGGIDDYIKVFKKNKDGLNGKFKVIGQVTLGLFVGLVMWFSPDAVIVEHVTSSNKAAIEQLDPNSEVISSSIQAVKSNSTTIPFVSEYDLGYGDMVAFMGENAELFGWLLFVFMCVFVVTACSNGANLTDGIDGLAAGNVLDCLFAVVAPSKYGGEGEGDKSYYQYWGSNIWDLRKCHMGKFGAVVDADVRVGDNAAHNHYTCKGTYHYGVPEGCS